MAQKNEELTLRAQSAIRSYLLRIVAPLGTVATIVAFIVGYGIQNVAEKSAGADAFKAASDRMLGFVSQASQATARADAAAKASDAMLNKLDEVLLNAKRIESKLKLANATIVQQSDKLATDVAEKLLADDEYKTRLTGATVKSGVWRG